MVLPGEGPQGEATGPLRRAPGRGSTSFLSATMWLTTRTRSRMVWTRALPLIRTTLCTSEAWPPHTLVSNTWQRCQRA